MVEKLKELDKKILTGLGITVAFLILWLVTLPHVSYSENPFDSYAGLNETQRYIQTVEDINNFNRAILNQDNTLCSQILNATMRKDCSSMAPKPSKTAAEPQEPHETINANDIDNYNRATLYNDSTYCQSIINEQMKADCLARG